MTRFQANCLLLLTGVLWGAGFVAQESAMDDIGPFLFVAMRFSLAALAIAPFAIVEARRAAASSLANGSKQATPRGNLIGALIVSTCFFIAMLMQQIGLLATTVTNAGMLTGLYIVMVPIIIWVITRTRVQAYVWICAALATFGIWLLGGGGLDQLTWGDAIVLLGAIFAALHLISIGHFATTLGRPVFLAVMQFGLGGIAAFIGFLLTQMFGWSYEPAFNWSTLQNALPEILYAAWIAGALAFTLMAICQQYTPATDAAVLMSSEALFAALGGALLLGERLSWLGYAGCILMFAAIVIVSYFSEKQAKNLQS